MSLLLPIFIIDGFVKSPSAALHCILRRCGVLPSTPHSSGIVCRVPRNAGELFTLPSTLMAFHEIITFGRLIFDGRRYYALGQDGMGRLKYR
ncbi:MAG: hypothetical protein NTY64_23805 [Deltaproteobacteria bacterium]|nr:hypothetical protein [Deltaproteobacteria bacterium]